MARYFIDTSDGDVVTRDETGFDLPDPRAARLMALEVLPDMAKDKIPNGDRREFLVTVRDEFGTVIYTATLALKGEWKSEPPAVERTSQFEVQAVETPANDDQARDGHWPTD